MLKFLILSWSTKIILNIKLVNQSFKGLGFSQLIIEESETTLSRKIDVNHLSSNEFVINDLPNI
jgi:hypothetical protein